MSTVSGHITLRLLVPYNFPSNDLGLVLPFYILLQADGTEWAHHTPRTMSTRRIAFTNTSARTQSS